MGFLQVKGVSEDTAETIVAARAQGPFRDLTDFWTIAPRWTETPCKT